MLAKYVFLTQIVYYLSGQFFIIIYERVKLI